MGNNILKQEKIDFEKKLYIYEAALEVLKAKIALINIEYKQVAETQGLNEIQKVTSRIKKIDSIADKLKKEDLEFTSANIEEKIHDIVGCRIVALTLNDVEALIKIIRNSINNTEGFAIQKEKDYINKPKPSGYQSYHFQIDVPVTFSEEKHKVRSEIQVRTMAMDAWATLEHKLNYKSEGDVAGMLKIQFQQYANMVEATELMIATANNSNASNTSSVKKLVK